MTQKISQFLVVIILSTISLTIQADENKKSIKIDKDNFYIEILSKKMVEEQNKEIRKKLNQNQALIKEGQMGDQKNVQIPNITAKKWLKKIEKDFFQANTFADKASDFSQGINKTLFSMTYHSSIESSVLLDSVKNDIDLSGNLIYLARMYYEVNMSQLDYLINHSSPYIIKKAQKIKEKYQFLNMKIWQIQKRVQESFVRLGIYNKNQKKIKKK